MVEWTQRVAGVWLESTGIDIARYVIFAVAVWLVLWIVLKGVLRGRKIREETPPARQLAVEFLVSIRSIAIFSTVGLSMFLLEARDYCQVRPWPRNGVWVGVSRALSSW